MIQRRHPDIAATIVRAFRVHWREQLRFVRIWWTQGLLPRLGEDFAGGLRPNATFDDDDPSTPKHGWQFVAISECTFHRRHGETQVDGHRPCSDAFTEWTNGKCSVRCPTHNV